MPTAHSELGAEWYRHCPAVRRTRGGTQQFLESASRYEPLGASDPVEDREFQYWKNADRVYRTLYKDPAFSARAHSGAGNPSPRGWPLKPGPSVFIPNALLAWAEVTRA